MLFRFTQILLAVLASIALTAQAADRKVAGDEEEGTMPPGVLGMPAPQHPHPIMGMPAYPYINCKSSNQLPPGVMGIAAQMYWTVKVNAAEILPLKEGDKASGVAVQVWNNYAGQNEAQSFTATAKRIAPHGYALVNKSKGFTLYMSAVNTSGSSDFTGHLTYHAGKGNYVTEAVTCSE